PPAEPSSLESPAPLLRSPPQQPISRARSLAKPPSALPCFIGTSSSGILGFGVAKTPWPRPFEPRDIQQRSAFRVSSFSLFRIEQRRLIVCAAKNAAVLGMAGYGDNPGPPPPMARGTPSIGY